MTQDIGVLERVRKEIIETGRDSRYKCESYGFVLQGLEYYLSTLSERRHVTGGELAMGLAQYGARQFGLMGMQVLEKWGIHSTNDFGYIVYNMIDVGIMSKQDTDRVDDFFNVFDLREFFEKQDFFVIDPEYVRRIRGA
jgi:uncharacterized repeat protein (TIGR04138 family)